MTSTTQADLLAYPRYRDRLPVMHQRSGRYVLRFAASPADLDRITKLRFEVFNLEIGEGLASSWASCRDRDHYDAVCHHLMVTVGDGDGAPVVGTYRMQTSAMAATGRGFYADEEFDLSALATVLPDAVELGRACIAREHRNQRVLFLLWRGLAAYLTHNRQRYFFGCCSLTGQDARRAARVDAHLREQGLAHPRLRVLPRAPFAPLAVPDEAVDDAAATTAVQIPPLMQLYLDYGARIVSAPAIDHRFNTIDFLALFDLDGLSARVRRMFFA